MTKLVRRHMTSLCRSHLGTAPFEEVMGVVYKALSAVPFQNLIPVSCEPGKPLNYPEKKPRHGPDRDQLPLASLAMRLEIPVRKSRFPCPFSRGFFPAGNLAPDAEMNACDTLKAVSMNNTEESVLVQYGRSRGA